MFKTRRGQNAMTYTLRVVTLGTLLLPGYRAMAEIEVFQDKGDFLAATGAYAAEPLENLGVLPGGSNAEYTQHPLTYTIESPSSELYVGTGTETPWTELIEGSAIAISGAENLNADSSTALTAIGFEFVEPTTGAGCIGCPCSDSVFILTLLSGEQVIDAFEFDAANDQPAFVGVTSTQSFDRIEVYEVAQQCDDEYFGQFFVRRACRPDIDDSGQVGFADLSMLLNAWGSCANCVADLDLSGSVGFNDLSILLVGWGPCSN